MSLEFEMGTQALVIDPGHKASRNGVTFRNVEPGTWEVTAKALSDGVVRSLIATKKGTSAIELKPLAAEDKGVITTESKHAGIYDAKHFRDDISVKGIKRLSDKVVRVTEPWYSINCDRTEQPPHYNVIPFGCVAKSEVERSEITYGVQRNEAGNIALIRVNFIEKTRKEEAKEKLVLKVKPKKIASKQERSITTILLIICIIGAGLFAYNKYYNTFIYNGLVAKLNTGDAITQSEAEFIQTNFASEALPLFRNATANLIKSTTDLKQKLALEVQQYAGTGIVMVTLPGSAPIVVNEYVDLNSYISQQNNCAALIAQWDQFAKTQDQWRYIMDGKSARYTRDQETFFIPMPLLPTFQAVYPPQNLTQ